MQAFRSNMTSEYWLCSTPTPLLLFVSGEFGCWQTCKVCQVWMPQGSFWEVGERAYGLVKQHRLGDVFKGHHPISDPSPFGIPELTPVKLTLLLVATRANHLATSGCRVDDQSNGPPPQKRRGGFPLVAKEAPPTKTHPHTGLSVFWLTSPFGHMSKCWVPSSRMT